MELIKNKIIENPDLHIATGRSRNSKKWKNEEISWSDFIDRLSNTVYTNETVSEFQRLSKDEKAEIKDVGGYVGGYTKDGSRAKASIQNRSFLALDLDHVEVSVDEIWERVTDIYNVEMVMHSSHSHRPKRPRLRLIIPTDRFLLPEEYQVIGRTIAFNIGIDLFDKTTFEPNRLMFWPSTPKDGEYIFKHNGGELLSVNRILDSYEDWKDISSWPVHPEEELTPEHASKKLGDPLSKPGIIGAFNRTYTITEAINSFLSEKYVASVTANRFSYVAGSTSGGLVIYDDLFAYSHHESDPVSGKTVNAFDLVRLHLFGELDSEAKPNTPVNRVPSYKAMSDFARDDTNVKKTLIKDGNDEVDDSFDFTDDEEDWIKKLDPDSKGGFKNTTENARLFLENLPELKGKLVYNEFSNRTIVREGVPWTDAKDHEFSDTDDSGIRSYLEKRGITSKLKIDDAKNLVLDKNRFHPVRDYLTSLTWDGKERVESLFIDYLGVEDNLYTRAVAKVHLVASVARIMVPGIKYDTMVMLVGAQGIGKSTFIRLLSKGYYSDSLDTMKGKEAAEHLQGVWHIELGELNAFRKSDRDQVKAFLSKQEDIYRVAYERNTTRFKRQCVFWGTTNDFDTLRDPTGDRRTFPIDCFKIIPTKSIFEDLEKEVDQIWAEAFVLWKSGEKLFLEGEALELAKEQQKAHKEDTPLFGIIDDYLERMYPSNWEEMTELERQNFIKFGEKALDFTDSTDFTYRKDRVCAMEVWVEALGNKKGNLKPQDSRQINDILKILEGWERIPTPARFGIYGKQRGYQRV